MRKCNEWNDNPEAWNHYYDPAASWFQVSIYDQFEVALSSIKKHGLKKRHKESDSKVSTLKDIIMRPNMMYACEETCKPLFYEFDNWCYLENGDLPDKDDHLIDDMLYFLEASQVSVNPEVDPTLFPEPEEAEAKRGIPKSFATVIREEIVKRDPFAFIEEPYDFGPDTREDY